MSNSNTKSGIYKITNHLNGKVYIGQTINYKRRKREHYSELNYRDHRNPYLQKSWDKNGPENFTMELIHECECSDLDYWEVFYINDYESMIDDKGYNLISGGNDNRVISEATRKKMSASRKGRKFSEEHRNKISKSLKGKVILQEWVDKSNKTKRDNKTFWGEENPNATFSNTTAKEIIIDLLSGLSNEDVSLKHKVSINSVYNIIYNRTYVDVLPDVRNKLSNKKDDDFEDKIEKVISLYKEGYSQMKISKIINMSRNTIRRELEKRKIKTNIHVNQFVKKKY